MVEWSDRTRTGSAERADTMEHRNADDIPTSTATTSAERPLLILTLYCGENEHPLQLEALSHQTFTNFEQVFFSYMPNAEAHKNLYKTIMENKTRFEYFLKLDADMVPSRPTAIGEMMDFAMARPEVDHFLFRLHDFFTGRLMPALHLFSNRVYWEQTTDSMFVDPDPLIPGKRLKYSGDPVPFVTHAPDPSEAQSFQFGVHRGLKAFQPDRADRQIGAIRTQFEVLSDVFDCWQRHGDRRRLLVIAGADMVAKGRISTHDGYKLGERVDDLFRTTAQRSTEAITAELAPFWFRPWRRRLRLWQATGIRGVGYRPRKKLRKALGHRHNRTSSA